MKKVLEIGCGQGFFSHVIAKNRNKNVVGVDISKEDISIAKKRYPHVTFQYMSAESLKFKKDYFEEVYVIEVLEHVDNLDKTLDEISRVLKVNGRLVVSVPYYKSEAWLIKLRPSYFKEIHHVRVFKENQLERLASKRKLKVTKKRRKGFLQHIELFILFKRKTKSKTQLSIGSWRDTLWTRCVHAVMLFFDPMVLHTPLVYFPVWIVTLPMGWVINAFGNNIFPKSQYYEFIKE